MSVAVKELPGVRTVNVSLTERRAVIELDPHSVFTLARVRDVVARSGFVPQAARVTARARLVERGDRLSLEVTGTDEVLQVTSGRTATGTAATARAALAPYIGRVVLVDGLVPAPKEGALPTIELQAIKPEGGG